MFKTYFESTFNQDSLVTNFNLHSDSNIGNSDLNSEVEPQAPVQLCDIHLSVDEVESCLINLDHTKASGPDQIPGTLLKLTATEIAPSLTRLFNHSLQLGKMPRIWKQAYQSNF